MINSNKPDFLIFQGSIIPSPDLRWCGPEFKDDAYYLNSAEEEAQRLLNHCNLSKESRVLDVGCGQGRLAIGIQRCIGDIDYLGLDVDEKSVNWCSKNLTLTHPSFSFKRIDVANARYLPLGAQSAVEFQFDLEASSRDIIYLYSVFSHMTAPDTKAYLKDFHRILSERGTVVFTTFIEQYVPDWEENPPGYKFDDQYNGPLHVVRFEQGFLFNLISEAGFLVEKFVHGQDANGQSSVYLKKCHSSKA